MSLAPTNNLSTTGCAGPTLPSGRAACPQCRLNADPPLTLGSTQKWQLFWLLSIWAPVAYPNKDYVASKLQRPMRHRASFLVIAGIRRDNLAHT